VAVTAVLALAMTGVLVYMEHARTLAEGRMVAARLSQVLEEQTLRTVQAVDLTLLGIGEALLATPGLRPHDAAFEDALRRRRDRLPFVRALFVIGADGVITQDTDHPHTPRVTLADRAYFRVHREDPSVRLYIGPPLVSRSAGTWFISMSRRIPHGGGRFEGIVVAAVEPRYFEQFYEKLSLGAGDSIALFDRDGTLLSRIPYVPAHIGRSFSDIPLFRRQLAASRAGVYRSRDFMDGVSRVVSYRTVEALPLVVAVGLAEGPMLAGWRRATIAASVGMTMMIGLAATVLVLLARQERQREELRERLAQAQKLEALGRMTGIIAHDFNNVLNVVATYLEVIRKSPERAPVDAALRAVKQGTRLASQLLTFARRQELAVIPLDANELIAGLMPLLAQAAGASVEISTRLARDLWPCLADETQFNSAILNLVVNARDAMPDGRGRIRITTENSSLDGAGSRHGRPGGDYVHLTVTDDGRGMPVHVLRQAAEPFYTTKGPGIGTGLGLSQVYGFIQQVGGDLQIESTVGVGTSVHLFFRRATEAAARSASATAERRLRSA
jgi:signal transduction histidine kinase